jgi:hypothetical protein
MSAFMCTDEHIAILAEYACARPMLASLVSPIVSQAYHANRDERRTDAEIVGAALYIENEKSVRARYPSDSGNMVSAWGYVHRMALRARALAVPAVAIIKATECYRYQACEHDGWEGSAVEQLTAAIISDAIGELPGYDAAAWGAPEMPKPARVAS